VHVVGVAKTTDHREINRPLLFVSIDELLTRVKFVRQHVAKERVCHNIRAASDITVVYNTKVNALLKTVLPTFTSHRCRELYANVTYHFSDGGSSRTAWISRVLCHKPGIMSCAHHYTGMNILGLPPKCSDLFVDVARIERVDNEQPHVVLEDAAGQAQSFARHVPKEHALPASEVILVHENGMVNRNTVPTPERLMAVGFGRRTVDAHRKRKRNVDESVLVAMIADRTGKLHRIERNSKKRDGKVLQRLLLATRELKGNGIDVTDRTLRRLGFSARTLVAWRRAQKND
jgi:hypothetical protein